MHVWYSCKTSIFQFFRWNPFLSWSVAMMFSPQKKKLYKKVPYSPKWRVCVAWEDWLTRVSKWEVNKIIDSLREYFHKWEGCTGRGCIAQTGSPLKKNNFLKTEAGTLIAITVSCIVRKCFNTTDTKLFCTQTPSNALATMAEPNNLLFLLCH